VIENFVADFAGLLPFGYAFGAGMVTTVSPCGIAMLPAYVGLYLGTEEEGFWARSPVRRSARALALSAAVTTGFVLLFGIVGALLSWGGQFLMDLIPWAAVIIGVALVVLGIYLLAGRYVYVNLPGRLAGLFGKPESSGIRGFAVFGVAYGVAALSCTLPIFMIVVAGAISLEGFASGMLQFVSFALGMGFVVTLITVGAALFKEAVTKWLRRLVPVVYRISGLLLVFAGSYILYYWFIEGDILG
jgi:cytochrome c biogenesis protein CcdA